MRWSRQSLVFDADDTLWENNRLFERVIDDFMDWLDHPTLDRLALRAVLDDIEAANTQAHGYGSRVFLRSLADCFAHLSRRPASAEERRQIETLADAVVQHRIELLPDVVRTLTDLAGRHDLYLLTKGDPAEQQAKIDASGLTAHFLHTRIVPEKNVEAYRTVARDLGLQPDRTWMIGNSPRSDIRPARMAGWQAVFVPNANTWILEDGEVDTDDAGILHVRTLDELTRHF